jgi:hypothetical protein
VKRIIPVLLILACLSVISGILMSEASFAGRAGINLFYKKYSYLKTWWQGALSVFLVLMVLFIMQGILQRKLSFFKSRIIHSLLLLTTLAGLLFTYSDFRHTTTHRWLGERFHIGAYLFWMG